MLVDLPENFLPEAEIFCSAVIYLRQQIASKADDGHLRWVDRALASDYFRRFTQPLEDQEPATEEEAAAVIRLIVSTTTLQNNVTAEALMEVFMEIIREEGPSGLALNLARRSIRNEATFAPSPKEFRDALLQAIRSIKALVAEINSLYQSRDKLAERLSEPDEASEDHGTGDGEQH